MDHRRRFTEAILAGVSVGVMGVDNNGRITIANQPALTLFSGETEHEKNDLVGRAVGEVISDLPELLEEAKQRPHHVTQFELPYTQPCETKNESTCSDCL